MTIFSSSLLSPLIFPTYSKTNKLIIWMVNFETNNGMIYVVFMLVLIQQMLFNGICSSSKNEWYFTILCKNFIIQLNFGNIIPIIISISVCFMLDSFEIAFTYTYTSKLKLDSMRILDVAHSISPNQHHLWKDVSLYYSVTDEITPPYQGSNDNLLIHYWKDQKDFNFEGGFETKSEMFCLPYSAHTFAWSY